MMYKCQGLLLFKSASSQFCSFSLMLSKALSRLNMRKMYYEQKSLASFNPLALGVERLLFPWSERATGPNVSNTCVFFESFAALKYSMSGYSRWEKIIGNKTMESPSVCFQRILLKMCVYLRTCQDIELKEYLNETFRWLRLKCEKLIIWRDGCFL